MTSFHHATALHREVFPRKFGDYYLLRSIGEGSMGRVFEALHRPLERRVALKLLPRADVNDPRLRERLQREGVTTARVLHPNVVEVFDVGVADGVPYLTMKLLQGIDLQVWIEAHRAMRVQDAVDLVIPLCDALGCAHREGVVHRDLKPSNIFLATSRPQPVAMLLDFGIARDSTALWPDDTETTSVMRRSNIVGSPFFMAPEALFSSDAATSASDQFSLGVILYYCVTGCRPFQGNNPDALRYAVATDQYIPIERILTDVPADYAAVVRRALRSAPDKRFASMWHLASALLPLASTHVRATWQSSIAEAMKNCGDAKTTRKFPVAKPPPLPVPRAQREASVVEVVSISEEPAIPIAPPSTDSSRSTSDRTILCVMIFIICICGMLGVWNHERRTRTIAAVPRTAHPTFSLPRAAPSLTPLIMPSVPAQPAPSAPLTTVRSVPRSTVRLRTRVPQVSQPRVTTPVAPEVPEVRVVPPDPPGIDPNDPLAK
jgi:serine/threonine protein kinase